MRNATIVRVNPSVQSAVDRLSPNSQRLVSMALDNRYELVVHGMPYHCPDCGRNDQVVAFVHDDDPQPSPHEAVGTEAGMSLAFAADILQAADHPLLASIKRRSFPGGDETYLSNGCSYCDEIADPFQLADETTLIQEKRRSRHTADPRPRDSQHRRMGTPSRTVLHQQFRRTLTKGPPVAARCLEAPHKARVASVWLSWTQRRGLRGLFGREGAGRQMKRFGQPVAHVLAGGDLVDDGAFVCRRTGSGAEADSQSVHRPTWLPLLPRSHRRESGHLPLATLRNE
jgi:hypothetical protein